MKSTMTTTTAIVTPVESQPVSAVDIVSASETAVVADSVMGMRVVDGVVGGMDSVY